MRVSISTTEIAKRFGRAHRNVMRDVKRLLDYEDYCISALFTESSYISLQNKDLPSYNMGLNGFCLLTDTWGYSRGESAIVKAEILNEFGESFVVVGSARTRYEDDFFRVLKEFIAMDSVIRQFPVGGYRVDFYLPNYGIVIEYDEEQHFSKSAKLKDGERELAVIDYFLREFDDTVRIIRVKKGEEMRGLSRIAGEIALCTQNAIGITKYAE